MNDILFKVDEAIRNYYNKYERHPNTILINENDLNLLKQNASTLYKINTKALIMGKTIYEVYGLRVMPIKYGEIQAVEVIE